MQALTLDRAQRLISTREMRAMLGIEPPPLPTTSIKAIPNQSANIPTDPTDPTDARASEPMPSSSLPPAADMPFIPYPRASEPITSYPLQEVEAFALAEIEGVDEDIPLRVNEVYKLLAAILRDKPSGLSVQALRLPDLEVIEIDITVRASGFDIAPNWHQRLKFIRGRDSGLVEFILVPKETGDKKIEVEFYYERHWLTAIVLDVTVIAHDLGGE